MRVVAACHILLDEPFSIIKLARRFGARTPCPQKCTASARSNILQPISPSYTSHKVALAAEDVGDILLRLQWCNRYQHALPRTGWRKCGSLVAYLRGNALALASRDLCDKGVGRQPRTSHYRAASDARLRSKCGRIGQITAIDDAPRVPGACIRRGIEGYTTTPGQPCDRGCTRTLTRRRYAPPSGSHGITLIPPHVHEDRHVYQRGCMWRDDTERQVNLRSSHDNILLLRPL
jgi:hypothetical protein